MPAGPAQVFRVSLCPGKAPIKAFSLLKASPRAFPIKNLLRHYAKQAFKHCIYTIVRKDHGMSRCPRSQLSGVTSCSSQRRRKMIYLPDTQNCVTSAQLQLLLLSTHIHSNRVENRRTWVRTKLKQALVGVCTATEM